MSCITSINDAAGVAALLDQLKASPQWQEIATGMANQADPSNQRAPEERHQSSTADTESSLIDNRNESVTSLLSQLELPAINAISPSNSARVPAHQSSPVELEESRKNISFRAALPILSDLAEHKSFLSGVKKMKDLQDALERDLWTEREAIYSKYKQKFKTAQAKAKVIGTSVSQYETDMMTDAFKKEIHNFDNGRAIPAWDALVSRQQQELEQMKVPAMFHATASQDRKRQQQVIQVIETIAGLR